MQPSPLSMNWAELHSWPLAHFSSGFRGKNLKNDFQNIIFYYLKIDALGRITHICLRQTFYCHLRYPWLRCSFKIFPKFFGRTSPKFGKNYPKNVFRNYSKRYQNFSAFFRNFFRVPRRIFFLGEKKVAKKVVILQKY